MLSDQSLLTTARPRCRTAATPRPRDHSDTELSALFADGSALLISRVDAGHLASASNAVAAADVRQTPGIQRNRLLHVRADARQAGHARALLHWALADLRARRLAVRYVVDAERAIHRVGKRLSG